MLSTGTKVRFCGVPDSDMRGGEVGVITYVEEAPEPYDAENPPNPYRVYFVSPVDGFIFKGQFRWSDFYVISDATFHRALANIRQKGVFTGL